MATTELQRRTYETRYRAVYVLAGLAAVGVIVVVIAGLRRPPQMGADEDVFRTVDALYTAVRSHDDRQLGECERRLHTYRDAGKLPADAAEHLDGVIERARGGGWESAAERLYEFMSAQRRDGARDHRPPPKPRPAKGK